MNNTYILLRNNSESTPLSLEDLKRIGLLPSDLLWVECQSVCWQHPQEIIELKQLVAEAARPQHKPATEEYLEKFAPPSANETATHAEKSRVYVKLPSKGNSLKKTGEDNTPAKKETNTTYTSSLSLNDTLLDSDNKDTGVLQQAPKDKTALLESLLSLPPKKIALYAGLLAAGALMMLVISSTGGTMVMKPQPISQQTETVNTTVVEEPSVISEDSVTTIIPESYQQQNTPIEELKETPVALPAISQPANKTIPVKKVAAKKETITPVSEPPVKNPPPATEEREVKKVPVENIASKLQLKANEYNVAAFGGIRNLKMTLQNDSRYLLDKVSVELRYLNPEGAVVKTDTIDFNFVRPGEEATVAVKKTSRGVKVDYKITRIESKELATNAAAENNTYAKN